MATRYLTAFAFLLSVTSTVVEADEWGDLTGQFTWKGDIPDRELQHGKDAVVRDAAVCSAVDVYKDDIVIDKETKGIANIFVYLRKPPKKIHPDQEAFEPTIVFDQENCMFRPHALFVRAGQTVTVLNSDPITHNTHTNPVRNTGQNLAIGPNTPLEKGVAFPTTAREFVPIEVTCDFHPWMSARWLILDHPYAAITDTEGRFEIPDLPAGKHKFTVWHERVGYLERSLTVEIKDGETTELKPMAYRIEKK